MPDSKGTISQVADRPVILAACRIEIPPGQEGSPTLQCYYDRERTANPDLQKGLTCGPVVEKKVEDGKVTLDFKVLCTPNTDEHSRDVRRWNLRTHHSIHPK